MRLFREHGGVLTPGKVFIAACLLAFFSVEAMAGDSSGAPGTKAVKKTEPSTAQDAGMEPESPREVPLLIQALKNERTRVREAAARSLGKAGDRRAVDPLIVALGDPHDGVRIAAHVALKELGEPIGDLIYTSLMSGGKNGDERAGEARNELIRRKDPRILPPIINALGAWNIPVRVSAARTLMAIGDPRAIEPLIGAMRSSDKPVREAAAWALSKIGDKRAVGPMIHALDDSDDLVRAAAAQALGRLGGPDAVKPLSQALRDWHFAVRTEAAWSLGKIGDPQAVDPLLFALRDRHAYVREAAVWSISRFKDPRAIEPLIETLRDGDPKVREAAVLALGEMGDARAVDPVVSIMGDDNVVVRKAGARVLDGFREPLGGRIYAALEGAKDAAGELAAAKDPRSIDPLIRCLRNPDGKVRRIAASILGDIGDRRAVDPLVEMAGGWSLPDRFVGVSALLRIDRAAFSDLAGDLFRVASTRATLAYVLVLAGIAVLAVYGRRAYRLSRGK